MSLPFQSESVTECTWLLSGLHRPIFQLIQLILGHSFFAAALWTHEEVCTVAYAVEGVLLTYNKASIVALHQMSSGHHVQCLVCGAVWQVLFINAYKPCKAFHFRSHIATPLPDMQNKVTL